LDLRSFLNLLSHKIVILVVFHHNQAFLVKIWQYFKFLNLLIFPGIGDSAGVEPEKVGYHGIGLTNFESKT
jgi:hypothetical protein